MSDLPRWTRKSRKTIYDTPYLSLFEDTVELPNGNIVDDYSVVGLKDGVVIIATDEQDRLITFHEYKYAVNEVLLTVPAGGIDDGELPVEAAKRELLEETGYEAGETEYVAAQHVYPSKITHINHVVRIKDARLVKSPEHGAEESIGNVELIELKDLARMHAEGQFNSAYLLSALVLTLPEYLITR